MVEFMASLFRIGHHVREKGVSECSMNEQIIQDWLSECAALSSVEVNSFASSLKHNNDLITALYRIFDDYARFCSLIEAVSKQLFNFYRSRELELKLFTLQFVPNFIYIYLNSVAQGDKKSYRSIETLLIGIYNLEVVDDTGQPAVISFRLPSLAQASIYHEPMSLAHASLTETALRRLEECNTKLISWGPHPQVETLNAQNRLKTMTGILFIYNRHIGSLNKMSLKYLCKVSSRLASQGFVDSFRTLDCNSTNSEGSTVEKLARIPMSSQFFLELLCGLYYAMYNDFGYLAMQAVVDIYNRSSYECYANVIVVANAIRNSSDVCSTGETSEGRPMGISVALSPATNTVTTVNKFMITNASFRTKKLPDDIPIIPKDESGAGGDVSKPLTSITEEKEEPGFSARGSSLRSKDAVTKNLQKLGLGKKFKDKEGKSSSKTNLAGNQGTEKKQLTSFQMSNLMEKMSLKSPVVQNGDFGQNDTDSHSGMTVTRKKTTENGPVSDVTNGGIADGMTTAKGNSGFPNESSSTLTSESLEPPSSGNEITILLNPTKNPEDKPFMQEEKYNKAAISVVKPTRTGHNHARTPNIRKEQTLNLRVLEDGLPKQRHNQSHWLHTQEEVMGGLY